MQCFSLKMDDISIMKLMAIANVSGHLWSDATYQNASNNQFNAQLGFTPTQMIWNFFQRQSLSAHMLQH